MKKCHSICGIGLTKALQMQENGYVIPCMCTFNRLLGSFVKFGGGILGLAGEVAKHAGNLIYSSGRS
jgi:hypothetical protein